MFGKRFLIGFLKQRFKLNVSSNALKTCIINCTLSPFKEKTFREQEKIFFKNEISQSTKLEHEKENKIELIS